MFAVFSRCVRSQLPESTSVIEEEAGTFTLRHYCDERRVRIRPPQKIVPVKSPLFVRTVSLTTLHDTSVRSSAVIGPVQTGSDPVQTGSDCFKPVCTGLNQSVRT